MKLVVLQKAVFNSPPPPAKVPLLVVSAGVLLLAHHGQTNRARCVCMDWCSLLLSPLGEGSRDMVHAPWGPAGSLLGASDRA